MKREGKTQPAEILQEINMSLAADPNKNSNIAALLNNIHDGLREIQCATCFLGTATTDLENNYSDDLVFGAKICFGLLDTQFEQLLGHIESITTEVKQHATNA